MTFYIYDSLSREKKNLNQLILMTLEYMHVVQQYIAMHTLVMLECQL